MNNKGFTLLEIMVAISVLAVSIYILSNLQFRSAKKVLRSSEEIERVFFVKKYLYELYLDPHSRKKPIKALLEKPDITVIAHKQEIDPKKSSLRAFKDINIIFSEGTWKRNGDAFTIKMISFVPIEKKKKKDKP